jgi:hypothetical protein
MYNSDIPTRAELPTSKQLLRSTLIAIATAIVILVTIVLPAEYNIDPTRIGRLLGLAQMGEIKQQLADEAARDRARDQAPATPVPAVPGKGTEFFDRAGRALAGIFIGTANAQTAARSDETKVTLKPGEGAEVKLVMKKGAKVNFSWMVAGGVVNFDLHADGPGGQAMSYQKGRGEPKAEGTLTAAFDGNHGWFWRNRGSADVTVTLRVNGDYASIKRVQ